VSINKKWLKEKEETKKTAQDWLLGVTGLFGTLDELDPLREDPNRTYLALSNQNDRLLLNVKAIADFATYIGNELQAVIRVLEKAEEEFPSLAEILQASEIIDDYFRPHIQSHTLTKRWLQEFLTNLYIAREKYFDERKEVKKK